VAIAITPIDPATIECFRGRRMVFSLASCTD